MRRSLDLSLALVLAVALTACGMQPTPAAGPPQTETPPGLEQQDLAPPPTPPPLLDEELGDRLQEALEAALASPDTNWPGAVLHVRAPGLGAWSGAAGLGALEPSTPMRPHDRFRAGSLTKPFVAAVIVGLAEEGRLGLDDPIDALLPEEAAGAFPDSDRITVRMLLNHTSGLPDFVDLVGPEIVAQFGKVWEEEEFLAYAAAQEPSFAPGASFRYSNTNYLLLGMIIEEATGRTWREEAEERILRPLGLKDTLLPALEETAIPGDHAHGYADFGQGIVDATEAATASVVGAAGGQSLVTNAADLATFLEALLAGRLFQEETALDEVLSFISAPADIFPPGDPLGAIVRGYGLGLIEASYGEGLTAIGHAGDTDGGYHAFVLHYPEREITISGAVNVMDSSAGWVHLVPRVLEVLVPGYTPPELPAAGPPDAALALQGLLDEQVRAQEIPGMIMAVRLPDGQTLWRAAGHLDPAGEQSWTMETVSALGSVTKTYVAVVIMQLVEEGRLSLDDTIDAWFPDQPAGDRITVRMLLSHTSGLASFIPPEDERDARWAEVWTPQELVAEANRLGPVDEPGTTITHYSNTNYVLLGLIIEAVTGNRYEDEVRARIIEPLGLEHTAFVSEEGVWGGTLAEGYARMEDGYVSVLDIPGLPHASVAWAVGDIVSSLGDLMTFAAALFDGDLVSPETLTTMVTPLGTEVSEGRFYVLGGATLEGLPGSFGMGGDNPGYHAFFCGVQGTEIVVAALANSNEADVISPSLMALEYLLSLPAGDEAPPATAP